MILKKGIQVKVIAGKDKGKTGEILEINRKLGKIKIKSMSFRIITTISLVAGTTFLMWLGEQITLRGVGNGISLIIFSGIVAEIPRALASTFELGRTGEIKKNIEISAHYASKQALSKIEKAGGKISIVKK